MKKVLIVNVNWLGDAILTTPVFKALKKQLSFCHLACMCTPRVKEVFEDNPYVDEVIIFDEKTIQSNIIKKIKFISWLKKKKFDTVFLIHRSFTRAFICYLAGIKRRIGYQRFKNSLVLTEKIRKPPASIHRQQYYLHLFKAVGVSFYDESPEFFIKDSILNKTKELLSPIYKDHAFLIGINPSANWALKRWPADYYAKLADKLTKDLNAAIIFIGAQKDKTIVEKVIKSMKEKPYDFTGKTTLKELGAILSQLNLFISNDSGPAHLAASLGVNTLVIFGPTSAEITAPKGKTVTILKKEINCSLPCYNLECQDNICLTKITPEEVYIKIEALLADVKKNNY
ncbi:MAG: lipopolysaccharide heptosyltransferase II [Candidatus Omnitrophica bacterium]|jgi:lipopolysaccharide heptosyltransferase II|nr:lipopolysaccharide heptosyltransferase II [Candidatus Omnitrophota bacterium]